MIEGMQFAAVCVAAVWQTYFVLRYGSGRWWTHFVGRALFVKSAALMLLLVTQITGVLGLYPGVEVVDAVVLWIVTLAIIWQVFALERQRMHERRERKQK